MSASRFVDTYAADDDAEEGDDLEEEEEEEDEDDGEPLPEGFIEDDDEQGGGGRSSKRARTSDDGRLDEDSALHISVDQLRAQKEDADLRRRINAKYGEADDQTDIAIDQLGVGIEEDDIKPAASLLPSIKDPKLWLVGCEKECEEKAVLALVQKFNRLEGTADQLYIQSAFTTPASKNYVYVEAYKQDHVKRAVAGIRMLHWWKIRLVPITEMKDAVSLNQQKNTVKLKQWVRVKGGLYKSDLAQIIHLEDQDTRITIKLIPRIDKGMVSLEGKARAEEGIEGVKKFRKENRKRKAVRPLQALFDKREIEELGGEVVRKTSGMDSGCDMFKGQKFRHGFYIRTINLAGLDLNGSPPSQEELSKFSSRASVDSDVDSDDGDEKPTRTSLADQKKIAEFQKDDRVVVISGDTKNLTGRVTGVYKNTLTMMPDAKFGMTSAHAYKVSEVRKYFHVGDHVKVIAGKFKNETGLIVQVLEKENEALIYSDVSAREIQVSTQDVIESSAISSGMDALGDFSLYDLVILNHNRDAGVIIKVEVGSFKVMGTSGEVHAVKLQDIDKKRTKNFQSALDSQGNILQFKDVVRVINGPNKGKSGPVKHIHRSDIFLYSRQVLENSGIFVAPSRSCQLVGQPIAQPMIPASPGSLAERDHGNNRGPRNVQQKNHGKDPYIGKQVVITRGQWKGLKGVVSVATDQNYSVTMAAICKKITIPRAHVQLSTATNESRGYSNDEPFLHPSKTPDRSLSGATPSRFDGGVTPARTPSRDSMTPSRDSMTPSRDVWSAMTPARDSGMTPRRVPRTPRSPDRSEANEEEDYAEDTELYNQPWTTATPNPTTPHTPVTPAPTTPFEMYKTPKTPFTPAQASNDRTKEEYDEEENAQSQSPERSFSPTTPFTPSIPITPSDQPSSPVGEIGNDDDNEEPPRTPLSPPQSPLSPPPDDDNDASAAGGSGEHETGDDAQLELAVGVFVRSIEEDEEPEIGNVVDVADSVVTVQFPSGASKTAPSNQWIRIPPVRNDMVYVAADEHQGKVGRLIGIDAEDGMVRLDNQDLIIVALSLLLKYAPP